jgi:hypothetical protein
LTARRKPRQVRVERRNVASIYDRHIYNKLFL